MKPIVDPEGMEVSHFISACQPYAKAVLEVGCGDGNLTFQYARLPRMVMAFDPVESKLVDANAKKRASEMRINFFLAEAEGIPFPSQYFDIVAFTSSL
jgi:ubiquinone/menaquinone biosynthesis C-methylase UbiE